MKTTKSTKIVGRCLILKGMADSPSRLRATLEAFLPGQNDLNTDVVSTLGAKVAGDVFPVSISAAAFSMMTQAKQ